MFTRLKHAVLTLATTVAAYFVYAMVVVPIVEPSVTLAPRSKSSASPPSRVRKLDHLFPAGSWELERPKVLKTDHGTLFFDEYIPLLGENAPDRIFQLQLTRCTVVCYTARADRGGVVNGEPLAERRPVVLRALQGATLTFDGPLDFARGEFGKLVGCRLTGDITIHSPASEPGRDDAIEISTRNVQLDAEKIWTPHDVQFRYGGNTGAGRGLTIYLSRATNKAGHEGHFGADGLRMLELLHLDRLQLKMNGSGLFGGASPSLPSRSPPKADDEATRSEPVFVKCQGPFRFDFEQQLITLEDHVELARHNRNGRSDQLLCQLLEIHFDQATSRPGDDATSQNPARTPITRLEPTKVIATGYPVTIRAASVGVETGAERIEYDCILRRVWMKDRDRVLFKDPQREVEAKELRYALGDNGRLGELFASGPGVVRGSVGEPAKSWQVTWDDQVNLRRVEGAPVLSFDSHARIVLAESGEFSADSLHLYLKETQRPDADGKVRVELDRLHAVGHVTIASNQLSGQVAEARLWFRSPPAADAQLPASDMGQPRPSAAPSATLDTRHLLGRMDSGESDAVQRKFDLRANLIEALFLLGDEPMADRLVLRGAVELREVTPGELQPLTIRGDLFELQEGATEHPRGALIGQPAEVIARGMHARGERLHVYPGDGRLHILGPGDMVLAARDATPLAVAEDSSSRLPARISWQHQMDFDGQMATFSRDIVVNTIQPTSDGEARCVAFGELLRVQLTRRIDFQRPQLDGRAELAELAFEGWALLEVEMTGADGQRKLSEQMHVRDLTVNQITGEIRGQGPGWLRGIHRGGDLRRSESTQSALTKSSSSLNFLRVDFERTMAGNLHHRQIEFLHGTRTLFGPVDSWSDALDQIPEDELPPQAVVLTCQRLAVAQRAHDKRADQVDLEATGNAYVQGKSFSATGGRISYARAKDQLILEGDGRNRATLKYQQALGAPPSVFEAGTIFYWPGTRQCKVFDFGTSDINVSQHLRNSPPSGPKR